MTGKFLKVLYFVLAACVGNAWAQDYPARPVKIIVPYPPGGVPDVLARTVGQRLSETLGQQFVVENKPGAGGITAVMAMINAPADGYTLILSDVRLTAINPYLFAKLPYDTLRDLAPVTHIANSILYVAGSPRFGDFAEFVSYAKAHPGELSYGSAGIGSVHHITGETIKAALGINLMHVPYKGTPQSVPALLSGEVQMALSSLPTLLAHVKAEKVKLLAVTSASRAPQTPDVPAVSEFIPGYDFTSALGLLAPAGTPTAVVSKLAGEVAKAMKRPESAERLTPLGMDPIGSTPEAYAEVIRRDLKKYATAVKLSGAKAD